MHSKYNYTVIISHYNMPKLLRRAISSVPAREDIQVIIIDDCSPCKELVVETLRELRHPNLFFYTTNENSGPGVARNIGLDHAEGKWIIFVDSDDLLVENAFNIFDRYINSTAESIIFNSISVMSDDLTKISNRSPRTQLFDDYENGINDNLRYTPAQPWGRMIQREFINNNHIRFPEVRYSEDRFFSISASALAKEFLPVKEVVYMVTERTDSNTASLFSKKKPSLREVKERFFEAFRTHKMLLTVVDRPNTLDLKYYSLFYFKHYPLEFVKQLGGNPHDYSIIYKYELYFLINFITSKITKKLW